MLTLVPGFVEYCKIPLDRVTLLRKEDDTGADGQYRESPDGKRYTLPGAIVYDEADDLWQLGVAISVSPVGTFPDRYFSFTVAVTESSGKAMVMTGLDEKQQALDFNQPGELGTYFESLATICNAKLSEASRKSSKSSQFGFALAS